MRFRPVRRAVAVSGSVAALVAGTALASASAATSQPTHAATHPGGSRIKHVLLISVDGLHQQDLAWYVKNHPRSLLASLVRHGVEFSNARTPFPSDSYPGLVGQVTGGDPGVTGIYYDDTWNHDVFPAGTTTYGDPRHPDILGIAQHGVVFTGGQGKIAEHGGNDPQDRHVPILVVLPGLRHGITVGTRVQTTQIAPTILTLLGLDPRALAAVRAEHTKVLPGVRVVPTG